jgi:hypothetical protein
MNHPSSLPNESSKPDHEVDQWVAAYLDSTSRSTLCDDLATRILRSSGFDADVELECKLALLKTSTSANRRIWQRTTWLVATAASIVLAFTFGRWDSLAYASASNIVRAARSVHAMAVERCYVVNNKRNAIASSDGVENSSKEIGNWSNVRIWTQGNRFWVDVKHAKRSFAWGRNDEGTVWLTLGRTRGLQIRADEIGRSLEQICDLHSLEVESLLETVQNKWTLSCRQRTDTSYIVVATPKRTAHHRITEATIEIDRETKAIRQLILNRASPDGSTIQTTFTLVETRTPDESLYQPEGHLEEPYQILSRENLATLRRDVIKNWFGAPAENWIR